MDHTTAVVSVEQREELENGPRVDKEEPRQGELSIQRGSEGGRI